MTTESVVITTAPPTVTEKNLTLPGNPRYQPAALKDIFGYDKLFIPLGDVEIATLEVLGEIGIIPHEHIALLTPEVMEKLNMITMTEVDLIERTITKHDVRAWIRKAQETLPTPLRRWIHVLLTSYDPLDTGRILQFARAHETVLKPMIHNVIKDFAALTRKFAATTQIGRTHKQHALPITVGFWLATILHRIIYNAREMDIKAMLLVGKISGAVGAYNAQVALEIEKRCRLSGDATFEERVLAKLCLKPAEISTQILPPEPLAYFLFSCTMLSAALGQFGRDGRNLMASEIGEVTEAFEEGQVGSSTMAQKRNPINFENLEGTWLKTKNEFGKVLDTLISDNQRDLVASSLFRDFPTIVVNLTHQLTTLLRKDKSGKSFLSRISVDEEACRRNLEKSADLITAEPIYIAMQMAGYEEDAHELVNRRAVPMAKKEGIPLIRAVQKIGTQDQLVNQAFEKIPIGILELLSTPEKYTGKALEKALQIAKTAETFLLRY